MLAKVFSAVNIGLDSRLVEVEVDVSHGFPSFEIVGLPDTAVKEAKERVHSAIANSGLKFLPGNKKRLVVNLAPADVKKEGSIYDLPIAVGILIASEEISADFLTPSVSPGTGDSPHSGTVPRGRIKEGVGKSLFVGELALDGALRHTKGILPMVLLAKKLEIKNIFLPETNAREAALVEGLKIYPLKSLKQFLNWTRGQEEIRPFESKGLENIPRRDYEFDFGYIKGQEYVKRALEIVAAGAHNALMIGPPGAGKTLLARALPSILPEMTGEEVLEVTKIASVAGLLRENEFLRCERPFRAPHHTISDIAMVGGGQVPRPGEVSLAHRGVLFLDELPEFSRRVLESLRQPLEDGLILVSRARGRASYPAKFIFIASMNPCPCGFWGDPERECRCTPGEIVRYRRKISGPFLDRIDLHLEVPRVKFEKLTSEKVAEASNKIRSRVERARLRQRERFSRPKSGSQPEADQPLAGASGGKNLKILTNSEMPPRQIEKFCQIDEPGQDLLKKAVEKFALSARSYHRILKVARTIADLAGQEKISSSHLAEAIQYRTKLNETLF